MNIHFTPQQFLILGLRLKGFRAQRVDKMGPKAKLGYYRQFFGTYPEICSILFDDFQTTDIAEARIDSPCYKYFLITLHWMKTYKLEGDMSSNFDRGEKTLREHTRTYVAALQALKAVKIVLPDLAEAEETFLLTTDGVHCDIPEQHMDPDRLWKSCKTNSPGLAYELAISIWSGKLVWINGPHKGGTRDVDIFVQAGGLASRIPAGKLVLVDQGYNQAPKDKISRKDKHIDPEDLYDFKNRALARHEKFNGRIKEYKVLSERFRHRGARGVGIMDTHKSVFEAVCVIVQYEMDNGHPLFSV